MPNGDRLNVQHLVFKTDAATISAMTAAYKRWKEARDEFRRQQYEAARRIINAER